jgi:uncharacterized membrane protein YkvA (DUF1232 family)
VAALWFTKPDDYDMKQALRLLPDLMRLIKRLAADPDTPRGVRIRLALLLVYLALPIDLIPDFVPVLGYADDAIIVALVLRSATRRAGARCIGQAVAGHAGGADRAEAAVPAERRMNGCDPANTLPIIGCPERVPLGGRGANVRGR